MAMTVAVTDSDPRVHVARKKGKSEKKEGMEIVYNNKTGSSASELTFLLMITIGICEKSRPLLRHELDDSFAPARFETKNIC